ncbi:hypothetical protein L3X38_018009 [Prunus dulcis]|uniref:Transposable element protein n=1 Tax=Prunus dulcis TaxID=3755 RepID=A0AAD4Z9P1_PRUDU|nr:hypothetical protein L3X38_018009 [Prunus dulcis]
MDMVRSMMSYTDLPVSFWGYALQTAAYLLNRVPSKSMPKAPYEIWFGRKPSLNHLKIWGCPAYVKKHDINKLDARSEMCRFIGYPKETLGYYFYDPKEQKVFIARCARFLENEFAVDATCVQKVELKEKSKEPQEPQVEFDPVEIQSLHSHLPNLHAGIIPIRNKWIFKRKKGSDGKVTYKARLVAEGYKPREWIDYEETFSPLAMIKSIPILIAITAYYDYEIWHMDVKTAFLKGHLHKEIYMDQPEGFICENEEGKVCKLQRSIY